MDAINVAVIGFGLSGRVFHAPMINSLKEFNLKTIYTTNADRAKQIHERYPKTTVTADLKDIFRDETIDLVVNTALNSCHYSLTAEAIAANKNVIVEKPFAITSREADELIEMARKKNVLLSVYQNRRWDGDFKTVKKVIESGILGTLAEYESHMDNFCNALKNNWREENDPGSGTLFDLGAHLIDQAVTLFGLPEAVTADVRVQRECAKTVDNFEVILHYPKLKATLKSGMLVRIPLPRFILLGESGSFVKYGIDIQEGELDSGLTPLNKTNWGKEPEAMYGKFSTTAGGMNLSGVIETESGDYRDYYRNIYKTLIGEEELAVTPTQARNTIKIIEQAAISSEIKRTVDLRGLFD